MTKINSLKFVFFGSSDFSVDVLEAMKVRGFAPTLIITNPDAPKGRSLVMSSTPVKLWSEEQGIPFLCDDGSPDIVDSLKGVMADIFVVASYGKIMSDEVISIPSKGSLNIHPSLLPKYRGASPLESSIIAGDKETGVTIIKMDEKMDHGPIVAKKQIQMSSVTPGSDFPTTSELSHLLAVLGANLLVDAVPTYVSGEKIPIPQQAEIATYTKKYNRESGKINLEDDPLSNYLKYKAYGEKPGVFFLHSSKYDSTTPIRVKIKSASYANDKFVIRSVVPEGKKEMDFDDFQRGV